MKEIVQLNLTEEESIILQSLTAVGVSTVLKNTSLLEREIHAAECFMRTWPEASTSLANKMVELVYLSKSLLEAE